MTKRKIHQAYGWPQFSLAWFSSVYLAAKKVCWLLSVSVCPLPTSLFLHMCLLPSGCLEFELFFFRDSFCQPHVLLKPSMFPFYLLYLRAIHRSGFLFCLLCLPQLLRTNSNLAWRSLLSEEDSAATCIVWVMERRRRPTENVRPMTRASDTQSLSKMPLSSPISRSLRDR